MSKMSVLVHTMDKYEFCWKGFHHYFLQNWKDWEYPVYFGNEASDISHLEKVVPLHSGHGEWSDRLRCLLEKLDTKYVFYIQEDMWPVRSLPAGLVGHMLRVMEEEDHLCLKISPNFREYRTRESGIPHVRIYDAGSQYLLNHQASIWNREFFISCLPNGENPWQNEIQGTKRLWKMKLDNRIAIYDITWYEHVCNKGKFNDAGKRLMKEAGL